jgi:hypothetical protein
MQMKNVLAVVLLAFVAVALAWALLKPAETPVEMQAAAPPAEQADQGAVADTAAAVPAKAIDNGVVAYYLHPESRCATCLKIEELSKMALEDGFPEALAEGRLQWLALNVDQPENKHLMADFELHTTSLVLAERQDGETVKFKNCTRVWELVHSPMKFNSYVEEETAAFLGDA